MSGIAAGCSGDVQLSGLRWPRSARGGLGPTFGLRRESETTWGRSTERPLSLPSVCRVARLPLRGLLSDMALSYLSQRRSEACDFPNKKGSPERPFESTEMLACVSRLLTRRPLLWPRAKFEIVCEAHSGGARSRRPAAGQQATAPGSACRWQRDTQDPTGLCQRECLALQHRLLCLFGHLRLISSAACAARYKVRLVVGG